ncbi:MAG: hypothetical protein HN576_09280, partial [Bacteriovoracaceae bacterium]|nr:hypothetical protein [Bacteriovoracaceae bacterium]
TLRVISINDAPIPVSQTISFFESLTGTPVPILFTVNLSRDIEDNLFAGFFDYSIVIDDPVKGTLTDCMDKFGSTGLTDRTCTYTPINGDVNGTGLAATAISVAGMDLTAHAEGTYGNNISITIVENPITRSGGVNLEPGEDSVVIDVLGSAVTVTIETDPEVVLPNTYNAHTVSDVVTALNADNYASALFQASVNTPGAAAILPTTNLSGGTDAYDQITYRVFDGTDFSINEGVISISIAAVNDPPLAFTPAQIIVEDVVTTITLGHSDAEGDLATSCTVSALTSNIQLRNTCSCPLGVCEVDVVGLIDYNIAQAPGSFDYFIDNGQFSNVQQVDFTITPVDDLPLPVYQNAIDIGTGLDLAESPTAFPLPYTFNIEPAVDVDSVVTPTYEIITLPANGALTSCLNLAGSIGPTDLECVYVPNDGNINDNDLHTAAAVLINQVIYTANFDGNINGGALKNITIEIIETFGVTPSQPLIYFEQSGTIAVPPTNLNVRILVAPNATPTTAADIVAVWNAHPYAGQIITASTIGPAQVQITQVAATLNGGNGGIDYIDYKVTFAPGVSENGRININMTPVNDIPVICQFSDFNEAPECGILGCSGATTPVGNILPNKADIYYYDSSRAVCYKSIDIDSIPPLVDTDWQIVESHIADQYVNEKDSIIIENIKVDEGGGDTTEDVQQLQIIPGSLTSSNMTLVPISQIQIFYDDLPVTPGITFGSTASEDLKKFKIAITPAALLAGSSTISFQITDVTPALTLGVPPLTVTFDVIVNPVSALHNGWENIRALGAKVNSVGAVLDMTEACTYNRANCDGGKSCSGTTDPLNAVVPDKMFNVYYNTATKNCFYADGLTNTDWKPLKGLALPDEVYCNITPTEFEPACDQASGYGSCIGDGTPIGILVPTKENHFYWDRSNNTCWRSRDMDASPPLLVTDWEIYKSTGSAFLEWKPFTISGAGTLTGYNIFRRLPNTQFDYKNPINKTVVGVSTYNYTDNAENSWVGPVLKTVYFYEVRPVINNISTGTSEAFKEVRIMIPPKNMSFAHRWMINQSMCNTMNSTGIEASNNFRCPYVGPGDSTLAASDGYYDIGQDLIVERFEAGCNFTRSPACDTPYGDCVSDGNPNGGYCTGEANPPQVTLATCVADGGAWTPEPLKAVISTSINDRFYDRGSGLCFKSAGAGTSNWNLLAGIEVISHTTPENPPLVRLTQNIATSLCGAATPVNNIMGYAIGATIMRKLPSKVEQMAYSQWDYKVNTDSQVSILETGLSINSSPKCNSSNASGLAGNFSDTNVPDTNTMYSIPGTASSNIRSIITGSNYTDLCVSRFDVQDVVGNVKEWVTARIDCDDGTVGLSTCDSTVGLTKNGTSLSNYTTFKMDGDVGPCRDTNSDGFCDSFLDKWLIDAERYNAGRWFVPIGLPAHTNYPILNPFDAVTQIGDFVSPYMFEIGPSSGITAQKLHDDAMTINSHFLFASQTGVGAMATGGSYLNGQEAGTNSFEFLPFSNDSYGYITIGDVSIKARNTLAPNITFQIQAAGATACTFTAGILPTDDDVVLIDILQDGTGDLASSIIAVVNAGTCGVELIGRLSGIDQIQSTTLGAIDITASPATNTRVDVGFRCVLPVTDANYTE